MWGIVRHVVADGLVRVDIARTVARMRQQAAHQNADAVANHGAQNVGRDGGQAVMAQQATGAGSKVRQAVDQRAVHVENRQAGGKGRHPALLGGSNRKI
ncbi:hypothetical protein ATCC53582_00863 [Novacetimonas hansenii]|nr:hypothetical protein ATCC53582_00863 [Novacetimonas hansenii]